MFKKSTRGNNQSESKELEYAFKTSQEIFTLAELSDGIFCELNKNGENISRSKVRAPLREDKVLMLRAKISEEFHLKGQELDDAWFYLRTDLNKLLYSKFQKKKK